MRRICIFILFVSMVGCKKPYAPPAITASQSYLVVEGVINAGTDSTIIKLSRTVNLSASATKKPESGAILFVESDQHTAYALTETSPGNYTAPGLNLDTTRKYRLDINTTNNQKYISDFEPVKTTPPIDSVGFIVQGNGIQLYVNTHDPKNNTRYYLWNYAETWQFHAKFLSSYITDGTQIVLRTASQNIYDCFQSQASSSITLGSSAKLSQDVIYQNPITFVASNSEKIETKYSILVNQQALTPNAYTFWTNLKKNTEQLGSIFDAQPSNINGNIHNENNAAEPVIGYISVCTVQSKRIFISNNQLPITWAPLYPYDCDQDSDYFDRPKSMPPENMVKEFLIPLGSGSIPTQAMTVAGSPVVVGYLGSTVGCVDCTIRGTKTQPSFWR